MLLVATLRSDRLSSWQEHPALRGMSFGAVMLGPMAPEGFRQAIELPARVHGLELENGLADAIVDEVGTKSDALPLLAFALRELYEGYGRDDNRLDPMFAL